MTRRRPAEIRGNNFIGSYFEVTNPEDGAFGEPATPRTCDYCFFRHRLCHPKDDDCMVANKRPKQDFKIPEDQVMPEQIDGFEVGNYCRTWTHHACE